MKKNIRSNLNLLYLFIHYIFFSRHNLYHTASAFFPSLFGEAAILTVDGLGAWATTTIAHRININIIMLRELSFPYSIGLHYSAFTYYYVFSVNSEEYKLMRLAPYGDTTSEKINRFNKIILFEYIDLRSDSSLLLTMIYLTYLMGLQMDHDLCI